MNYIWKLALCFAFVFYQTSASPKAQPKAGLGPAGIVAAQSSQVVLRNFNAPALALAQPYVVAPPVVAAPVAPLAPVAPALAGYSLGIPPQAYAQPIVPFAQPVIGSGLYI